MNKLFSNKLAKNLFKYSAYILITISVFYIILGVSILYIGPITTLLVKNKLKRDPADIIVSLTTTPYRIDTIKPVLDSILRQSIKPNKIYLNIPYVFKRENREYIIPEWLKNYPSIIINRTKDYGPATKLAATLEQEDNPDAIIITFDDDKIYPRHYVRDLVNQYFDPQFNYTAITGRGLGGLFLQDFDSSRPYSYFYDVRSFYGKSLFVVGVSSVAYKRMFFDQDFFTLLDTMPKNCFLSDDLIISAYLTSKNIDIVAANGISYLPIYKGLLKYLPTSFSEDSLEYSTTANNNRTNYSLCIGALPKNDRYKFSFLSKSRYVIDMYNEHWLSAALYRLYYEYYLGGFIKLMPFAEAIYSKVLG